MVAEKGAYYQGRTRLGSHAKIEKPNVTPFRWCHLDPGTGTKQPTHWQSHCPQLGLNRTAGTGGEFLQQKPAPQLGQSFKCVQKSGRLLHHILRLTFGNGRCY